MKQLDVSKRERAIVNYLHEAGADGAPVRAIYDDVTRLLDDQVTRAAYYKILDRMEAAGKIELLREDPERGRIYGIAPTLNVRNPITIDGVYELLPFATTTEALALLVDARDYYEENRKTIIRRAAEALLREDPVNLFYLMIEEMVVLVRKDVDIIRHQNSEGVAELDGAFSRARLEADYRALEHVACRGLSLPHNALHLPSLRELEIGKDIHWDPAALRQALNNRVFGKAFIWLAEASMAQSPLPVQQPIVSGSDASMHAGTLGLQTAKGYVDDFSDMVTFNNSLAYVRIPSRQVSQGYEEMIDSEPFTRQVLDNPARKGMVLTQAMFPDLSEAEYEHLVLCATDVVQFRVDEEIFSGKASDFRPPFEQIPRPQVHFRDGTIAPQEREFAHYYRSDAYGEMVREGIRRERSILDRILVGRERAPIFAGAVKSTQMKVFGRLLNWYIDRGSKITLGTAIEPNWDSSRAESIPDNEAMTALLTALPYPGPGKYYVTCAVLRQFPSLTEYYNYDLGNQTWLGFFERKQGEALEENRRYGGTLPYHATVDLSDDDYVVMCERADYVSFYVGHTSGDPSPMVPRYEFLTSLREYEELKEEGLRKARHRVETDIGRIIDAIFTTGVELDRDHNFMSGKTLVKILPAPIQRAHEYSKALGKKLEAELKSIVISRLIQLKKLRADPTEVDVRPVSIRRYLERLARARAGRFKNQSEPPR